MDTSENNTQALGHGLMQFILLASGYHPPGLAGYGKGKWSRQGDMDENDGGDGNANKDLPYKLSMDTQEVLFNGALHALRQLLMEKRKQDPEASAGFRAFFTCSNKHVLGCNLFLRVAANFSLCRLPSPTMTSLTTLIAALPPSSWR